MKRAVSHAGALSRDINARVYRFRVRLLAGHVVKRSELPERDEGPGFSAACKGPL